MTKTYACPKCGRDVPLDKINVAKDIMLCPSCGEASCFSEVVGEIEERRHADDVRGRLNASPPKHLKVECDPMDPTGRIVLTGREGSGPSGGEGRVRPQWWGWSGGVGAHGGDLNHPG